MKKFGVILVSCMMCVWGGASSVQAQQSDDERLWSSTFGEGMRAWADSDYERALTLLYQSYALKPSSYNLSLIVRSHDFLGECHSALRQKNEFIRLYGKDKQPRLQICDEVSTLMVECPEGYGALEVWVRSKKLGVCGESLSLLPGTHEVSLPTVHYTVTLTLSESESLVHKVPLERQEKRPHVSKLLGTADRYTIFMTPDGLYQIWVLSEDELLRPYEGNLCTREDKKGKASCRPLTKEQRDELEKAAPRILLLPD